MIRRKIGSTITPEAHAHAMERIEVYKTWFIETFLSSENSYIVMRSEDVTPKYRDDPPPYKLPNMSRHSIARLSMT